MALNIALLTGVLLVGTACVVTPFAEATGNLIASIVRRVQR